MKTPAFLSFIEPLEARIAPATFMVTTTKDITDAANDTGSLRDAILLANAAPGTDEITFSMKGTIKLASDLPVITDALTMSGPVPGKANGITINGNKHAIFDVNGATTFDLSDLTITKGQAVNGGGIYLTGSEMTLDDVTVTSNRATAAPATGTFGGGIYIAADVTSATIEHSKITGNVALGFGGAKAGGGGIFSSGTVLIEDTLISKNVAQSGAGVSSKTTDGTDGGYAVGGGVYASYNAGQVTIQNSTISGNKALAGKGGSGGPGDKGGYGGLASGGGVYSNKATVGVTGSVISGNTSTGGKGGAGARPGYGGFSYGGGVSSDGAGASLTIANTTVSGNKVLAGAAGGHKAYAGVGYGGGIYSAYSLTLTDVTVTKNSAIEGGGLAKGKGAETAQIASSTFSFNKATQDGGGVVAINGGTTTFQNCTIAKNTAQFGGGVSVIVGTINLHNSTVAQNKATKGGGGVNIDSGNGNTVEIVSTIIAGNASKSDSDVSGTFTADHDLIQNITGAVFTDANTLTGVDPLLGKLANNGGPTLTILPGVSSPVIDKGVNPDALTTDQRGDTRPLGAATDIGAVEVA